MSDREIDINLTKSTAKTLISGIVEPTPEEYQARIAQVLDRGWAIDRFNVNLPSNLHGEWVPRDPMSVARAETLGFRVDTEYATASKLNDAGDGNAIIGDVVFMVQPMWMHQAIEKQREINYRRTHLNTRKQKEEKDYEAEVKHNIGLEPTINSEATHVTGPEINEVLTPKTS